MNVSPSLCDIDGVRIPAQLLEHAKRIAVLNVLKSGFGFAGAEFGTGLVVAKIPPLVLHHDDTSEHNIPSLSSSSHHNIR
jgi:lipid-binding SYLF domain-containing protein